MSFLLFPNFYADALWHAIQITWVSARHSIKMDWICFQYAYHHRLHQRFQEFGR